MEVKMKIKITIVSLVLAILLTSCGGKGVYGKVTDGETGKPISGASVELDCTDCASDFTAKTDADGNYSFPETTAGNYLLSIVWRHPPACPGITTLENFGTSGDFLVAYAGYGGFGGTGNKRFIAVAGFQLKEGQGKKYDLKLACP